MLKNRLVVASLFAALLSTPALGSPLVGVWIEINGPGAARIGPCSDRPDRLCAMGLKRGTGSPSAWKPVGLAVVDVQTSGTNRWKGTYLMGKRRLPATLQMANTREVKMTACILMLCQSARYARVE